MVYLNRVKLTKGQRGTLVRFLTNAGTIILGGLVLGSFIGHYSFRAKTFGIGIILYASVLGMALWLSPDTKEGA